MKVHRLVIALTPLLFLFSQSGAQEIGSSALRIAVLPFGWGSCPFIYSTCTEAVASITNMVEEALFRLGRYRLIDRRALFAIVQEQGLSSTQLADPQTAATAGKLAGAQVLITGMVDQMTLEFIGYFFQVPIHQATISVTARAVRTEDGEILAIARATKTNRGSLGGGLATRGLPLFDYTAQQAVQDLVQQLDTALQRAPSRR